MALNRFHSYKLDKATRTPNGYLRVPATITRCGVFTYVGKNGKTVRELRHPDDVFHPESLATLNSMALTNEHPKERILDEKNTKNLIVGWLDDGVQEKDIYLQTEVTIFDDKTIQEVESGLKEELSMGYGCDLEEETGIFMGQAYDLRQRNIRYNHCSVVKKGRAGQSVRLHLDSDAELVDELPNPPTEEPVMKKVTIGGVEYDVPEAVAAALEKAGVESQASMDSMKAQLDAANEKLKGMVPAAEKDAVVKDNDALKAKNDSLEEQLKAKNDAADPEKMQAAVKARVQLEKVATVALKPDVKLDSLSDIEIKKQVIMAREPKAVLEGKSETYINARFDSVSEAMEEEVAAFNGFSRKVVTRNDGGEVPDSAKAREKMIAESQAAWKTQQ